MRLKCGVTPEIFLRFQTLTTEKNDVNDDHGHKVYWSEDFFEEPKAVVEDALRFIGLESGSRSRMNWTGIATPINAELASVKKEEPSSHILANDVSEQFRNAMKPFNAALEELLGAHSPWPD